MRISDWSSDVCSSDLGFGSTTQVGLTQVLGGSDVCLRTFNSANCTRYLLADLRSDHCRGCCSNPSHAWSGSTLCHWGCYCRILHRYFDHCFFAAWLAPRQIGIASCRESVCQYVYISVVAVSLKKKKKKQNKKI